MCKTSALLIEKWFKGMQLPICREDEYQDCKCLKYDCQILIQKKKEKGNMIVKQP